MQPFLNCSAGMNSIWYHEISEKQPCYLPFGKADGTASPRYSRDLRPTLSRACGKPKTSISEWTLIHLHFSSFRRKMMFRFGFYSTMDPFNPC